MPRVSEQYKDRQRSEILDAARRCFVRNGFHRTSMQDVFTESGRSAGAVYRYFPRKQDMILGVAEQNLDDVAGVLRRALDGDEGDRADRSVGEVMAELLEAVRRRHHERDLASVALMVWAEALRDPQLAERLRDTITAMTAELAPSMRTRQSRGQRPGPSAEALSRVILAVLPGFLLELSVLGDDVVSDAPAAMRRLWPE